MSTTAPSAAPDERGFNAGSWIALGYALLLIGFNIFILVMVLLTPGDGWVYKGSLINPQPGTEHQIIFEYNLGGGSSPIMPGDELVAIEGLTLEQLADRGYTFFQNRPPDWRDGTVLRYTVLRDGQLLDLDVPLYMPSLWQTYVNYARLDPALFVIQAAGSLFFLVVGAVVFYLRPRERAAHALLIFGAAFLLQILIVPHWINFAFYRFPPPSIPFDYWMAAILPSVAYLVLVFPRPRWPLRRFPRLSVVLLYLWAPLAIDLIYLLNLDDRSAYVMGSAIVYLIGALGTLVLVVFGLIYAAFTLRGPVERAQLGWMALGLLSFMLPGVGGWLVGAFVPSIGFEATRLISVVGWFLMPVCLAIAITRYRLFDIDVIIRRTLIYGTLTAILALIYLGTVVVLQQIMAPLLGGNDQITIVASTLAIAALFNPLRRRIQQVIDRRFYRRKYDAQQTLQAFSARLRDETDLDQLTDDTLAVVQDTLQPAHVSLWLRKAEVTPGKAEQ